MHRKKRALLIGKLFLLLYILLPDAVCATVVGVRAGIIGLPAAVSVVFHVGAIRIIRNIVSAIGVVIDAAVVGAVDIAPVQVVGQAGAVIVEGGIGAVIIVCWLGLSLALCH